MPKTISRRQGSRISSSPTGVIISGFRSMLIRGLSLLQFHETRIFLGSDVVEGKNGWLFIRPIP